MCVFSTTTAVPRSEVGAVFDLACIPEPRSCPRVVPQRQRYCTIVYILCFHASRGKTETGHGAGEGLQTFLAPVPRWFGHFPLRFYRHDCLRLVVVITRSRGEKGQRRSSTTQTHASTDPPCRRRRPAVGSAT